MYKCFSSHNSEHPWFQVNLQPYLFPKTSDADASVVDTDAIREVCKVGVRGLNIVGVEGKWGIY